MRIKRIHESIPMKQDLRKFCDLQYIYYNMHEICVVNGKAEAYNKGPKTVSLEN